jgi:hypothetical protein
VRQLDLNNPYKRLGGGSLDQALFKKSQPQTNEAPPPASATDKPIASYTKPRLSTTPKTTRQQASEIQKKPNHMSSSSADIPIATRKFIKRTFDLYEDQLNYLLKESLRDRLDGKEGSSMNAWVREALDEWIKKREVTKRK